MLNEVNSLFEFLTDDFSSPHCMKWLTGELAIWFTSIMSSQFGQEIFNIFRISSVKTTQVFCYQIITIMSCNYEIVNVLIHTTRKLSSENSQKIWRLILVKPNLAFTYEWIEERSRVMWKYIHKLSGTLLWT